jgi:hypothetical protein
MALDFIRVLNHNLRLTRTKEARIDFYCECGRCDHVVWLEPHQYDELVLAGRLVLYEGHDALWRPAYH